MTSDTERAVRTLSLVILAIVVGVQLAIMDWFPAPTIRNAYMQAVRLGAPPDYVAEDIYDREGVQIRRPDAYQHGLTMVTGVWPESDRPRGLRLLDMQGRAVHSWEVRTEEFVAGSSDGDLGNGVSPDERLINGFALLRRGHVIVNLDYVGTVRLDACGEVVWRLSAPTHHSVERTEDGDFWIPTFRERHDVSDFPGLEGPVFEDRMARVTPGGEIVEHISVLQVLYDNDLERYIPKGHPEIGYSIRVEKDVTHLNDIDPLPSDLADDYPLFEAGDVLVSLRKLSLVFVLDPESRKVKWHASDPFIHQHDPDWMEGGWIGVFDNNDDETERGGMLGGSRIVAIQPHTNSMKVLFPTPESDPFYTEVQGSWQGLENGNLLLTESRAGRVVEVTPDGETAWEWIAPPYEEGHVTEVPRAKRYSLTRKDVAAWSCGLQ